MTADVYRVLLTGGTGRLGMELKKLLPGVIAPERSELDVTCHASVTSALDWYQPQVLVHAAAYTNVAGAERDRLECWKVNVEGTRNVVRSVVGRPVLLVYISTDYVFAGTVGMYREDDPVGPVCNYYALSKLVAEEIVRLVPAHLVIRTSFRPREWAYPVAFSDVYTSQDYVDIIAPDIALAVKHCGEFSFKTVHIATERKSVYELARRRRPDVREGTKREAGVTLPDDVSLDVSRWENWKASWREKTVE